MQQASASFFKKTTTTREERAIEFVLFDMFGTIVNWRTSIVAELSIIFNKKSIALEPEDFTAHWVEAYSNNMQAISRGERPFEIVDTLNKRALIEQLSSANIDMLFDDAEIHNLATIWHRLSPWPDAISGISALQKHVSVGLLSNGNIELLEDLSAHLGIHFDAILSGESISCYKPNLFVYQNAARVLGIDAAKIMLIASHSYDLSAAKSCGLQTGYIFRETEFRTLSPESLMENVDADIKDTNIDAIAHTLIYEKLNIPTIQFK